MIKKSTVNLILSDYSTGTYSYSSIAKKYGIHRVTVSNIINRPPNKDAYIRTKHRQNRLLILWEEFIRDIMIKQEMHATTIHRIFQEKGVNLSLTTTTITVKN